MAEGLKPKFIMNSYIIVINSHTSGVMGKIHEYIKNNMLAWGRVFDNTWIILSDKTVSVIRDELIKYVGDKDGIMVLKSGKIGAWKNSMCSNDFIKKYL